MAQVSYGTITITDTTDIDSIKNWYLATSASSGVTKETDGWTPTIQQMTESKQYLWNYEQILGTGGVEISSTQPVIIGRYGKDGTEGNSITSIDEYYQITNSTSNPGSSGWSKNTLVVPTSTNKYLWNYQVIHYSKTADEGSYSDARIIGVYGDKGERGTSILKVTTQPTTASGTAGGFSYSYRMPLSTVINESGKTEVLKGDIIEYNSNHYQVGYVNSSYVYLGPVTSIKGADSTQYYVFVRYSANSNGSGYVETPTSSTKYIGVYIGTSSSPPTYSNSGWTWSKYVGDSATQYYAFVKYATDSNGANMQDSPASGYDYVGTYTGTKANPTASDFNWSKYTGEPGTPATQYYAFIKYATSSSGANMTDTPTASTKYVGTYSGTKSSPTASDYKWSEYVGADGVSVTAVKEIYYLTTGNAPTAPSAGTNTTSTSTSTNIWTTVVPTYVPNGKYYTSIQTTLSKGTSPISSTAILNNALTDESYRAWEALSISQAASEDAQGALSQAAAAQYQAEALDAKLKAFFWPGDSNYTGAYAVSGIDGTTLNPSSISTYGFNVAIRPAAVSIGYNAIKALELDGATPSLKFYVPSKTTQATNPSMELTSSALTFYKIGTDKKTLEVSSNGISLYGSTTSTADATLTSSGLKLAKGGIEAGTKNTTNYIYVWSNDDSTNHTFNINSSGSKSDWRIVAGKQFGVDKAGNLYASNVNISGVINATSGQIGGWNLENNNPSTYGGALYTGNFGESGGIFITPEFTSEKSIGGAIDKNWTIVAGNKFGITTDGAVYMNDINIGGLREDNLKITTTDISNAVALADRLGNVTTVEQKAYTLTKDASPQSGKVYYTINENNSYQQFSGNTFNVGINYYEKVNNKKLSIHSYGEESYNYIQVAIDIDLEGLSFIQKPIRLSGEPQEVGHIDAKLDGIFYINKLQPNNLIFGNLEIIEYNGIALRRRN